MRLSCQKPRGSTILRGAAPATSSRSRSPVTKTSALPSTAEAKTHQSARHADAGSKHAGELAQHDFSGDERVLGQHDPEHIGAHSTGGEGADQDIRVEKDPHETSRTISSSVKYPRASANGRVCRRSRSNLSKLNWRRRASRTRSLRVRPVCLQNRASSFSRSGSSRMVIALFMSDNGLGPRGGLKAHVSRPWLERRGGRGHAAHEAAGCKPTGACAPR